MQSDKIIEIKLQIGKKIKIPFKTSGGHGIWMLQGEE